jgi:hypothetical protein
MSNMTANPRGRNTIKEWALRLTLLFCSLLVAVLIAEVLARIFVPISDRRDNITLNGEVITSFVAPGLVYRQVSNEYDALTTITAKGHRAPEVEGNPDIVFIGDSFTFGYGVSDDETFVSLYCKPHGLSCANLGYPGSGTLRQVERLEEFLTEWDWRPREVKLFFFGMSSSFSAGNDFVDNYDREMQQRRSPTEREEPRRAERGVAERIIGLQSVLLRHSNLARLAKFYAGPLLKSLIVAEPGEDRMAVALEATRAALTRLDDLSRREGFGYSIYLLVPVHDLLRGTAGETLATLNRVAPKPAIPTASLFAAAPNQFYFAFDGHVNRKGNERIAEFLAASEHKP